VDHQHVNNWELFVHKFESFDISTTSMRYRRCMLARGRGVMGEALPALFHYAQEELGVEIISGLSNANPTTL
jgi:hypothetical protein